MQRIAVKTETHPVLDPESITEKIRLENLERLLAEVAGGVLPEQIDLTTVYHTLDLACGPGRWTMDVARALEATSVGVDLSSSMIEMARMNAKMMRIDDIAIFEVMDITQPLAFSDASFDLIHARFLVEVLLTQQWPAVLLECVRVLKPGGYLLLTEAEWMSTSSSLAETLAHAATDAIWKAGRGFSIDGHSLGITHALPTLLRNCGVRNIHIEEHLLDFSYGQPLYHALTRHLWMTYVLMQPFLTRIGYGSQEELYTLCDQLSDEIATDETFQGGMTVFRAWGQKGDAPEPEERTHFLPPIFPSLQR